MDENCSNERDTKMGSALRPTVFLLYIINFLMIWSTVAICADDIFLDWCDQTMDVKRLASLEDTLEWERKNQLL